MSTIIGAIGTEIKNTVISAGVGAAVGVIVSAPILPAAAAGVGGYLAGRCVSVLCRQIGLNSLEKLASLLVTYKTAIACFALAATATGVGAVPTLAFTLLTVICVELIKTQEVAQNRLGFVAEEE